jgi:hypothetical protein
MQKSRSSKLTAAMLAIVGIIHVIPFAGALRAANLTALYGVGFDDPNLAILMRHRAIQLGMLGLFLLYAAARPASYIAGLAAGIVSVTTFLWFAWSVGGYNALLGRVVAVDLMALVCLLVGAVACGYARTSVLPK